tara:strand:+ start:2085 stop:2684 length:600 start_codon:yes stop_codon:yes gene_type:complete
MFANQPLWDLGVIVEKDNPITYQKELDINQLVNTFPEENIKALHSNNFIPPIMHEIKNPQFKTQNIIQKYDSMFGKLPLSSKLLSIKKSFLNKEFSSFFNFYKLIDKEDLQKDDTVNLMYIQNLYFSNQLEGAKSAIDILDINILSPELLLYKIKIDVKLKNIESAKNSIDYFIIKFSKSDLMPYVVYEQKLIKDIDNE